MAGKKTEKRLAAALLALLLVLALAPAAWAQVEQSESFYVADYANVLKADTEESIIQANALLEERCQGAQIVVVTVDYLGGKYADDYAYELFNDWGVGSADYNNGMLLLLLATQEGKGWLAYGLGLTSQMDRDADGLLERYFWDDFDRGDYDGAVNKLFAALLDWYGEEYGVSLSADSAYPGQGVEYGERRNGMNIGSILLAIVVIVVLVNLFSRPRRRRYTGSGFGWGFGLGTLLGSRRRTPPPPPGGPMPPRGGRPFTPPPPGTGFRPPRGGRPGGFPGGRPGSGAGRGGRPGGGMGRGGGGFSGGGAGRR